MVQTKYFDVTEKVSGLVASCSMWDAIQYLNKDPTRLSLL